MRDSRPVSEEQMAAPVQRLFPAGSFSHFEQVPLGRKKIDLVFLRLDGQFTISVELKIANWKTALWQAAVNCQISNESYIAIWHTFAHRAAVQEELLAAYGVGLIAVDHASASFRLQPPTPRRISTKAKEAWYRHLLNTD